MPLNLLPPEIKKEIVRIKIWSRWQKATIFFGISMLLLTAGIWSINQNLHMRDTTVTAEVENLREKQRAEPSQDITVVTNKLNSTANLFSQLFLTTRPWNSDLQSFFKLIPTGITIQDLTITGSGAITFSGVASTRADFISFNDALKNSKVLSNVSTTATPSSREKLPFTYTASFTK